jgi:hypothetical protein
VGRAERISSRRVCETDLPKAGTPADRSQETTMNILNIPKLICLTIIQLAKQAWLLPQSFADAIQQRRQKIVLKELEIERLDRICNPSKYRGR